jgi:hypothetical protein
MTPAQRAERLAELKGISIEEQVASRDRDAQFAVFKEENPDLWFYFTKEEKQATEAEIKQMSLSEVKEKHANHKKSAQMAQATKRAAKLGVPVEVYWERRTEWVQFRFAEGNADWKLKTDLEREESTNEFWAL